MSISASRHIIGATLSILLFVQVSRATVRYVALDGSGADGQSWRLPTGALTWLSEPQALWRATRFGSSRALMDWLDDVRDQGCHNSRGLQRCRRHA